MTEQMNDNIVFSTLKKMFNNPDYSDIVFVVNNMEYKALRAFVGATTDVFEALLLKGFEEANQKKIVIPDVKNQESFYHILRYIYGMKIDFLTLSVELLCEMIEMAEYYHLPSLFTSIQTYLETIETCYHKSVGVLVNTAKLYKLDALYETCKNYILQNVSSLITSNDLTNISYDVLFDIMESSEIMNTTDISKLEFTLDWFNKNDKQTYSTNKEIPLAVDKNNLEKEKDNKELLLAVDKVDENNLEKEKDNKEILLAVDKVDKNNLETEKDKFILIIMKNINFDKITCVDLLNLFKGHDEYEKYEKIVNDFVINNYNRDIEKVGTNNVIFSMKQLSALFGEPRHNFLLKSNQNGGWVFSNFITGMSSDITLNNYSIIKLRKRSDGTPLTGIVAIFRDLYCLAFSRFKYDCFEIGTLVDYNLYRLHSSYKNYRHLQVIVFY